MRDLYITMRNAWIEAILTSFFFFVCVCCLVFGWGVYLNLGQLLVDSLSFSLGLATTLALLGVAASLAGKAYGQIGQGLPIGASALAIVMGLNLLEVCA